MSAKGVTGLRRRLRREEKEELLRSSHRETTVWHKGKLVIFMKVNVVYNNSCVSMDEIEDNSIDTIITSCPYWGLRDYGKQANQIWGGDPECEHEWIAQERWLHRGSTKSKVPDHSFTNKKTKDSFCQLCGAYYGQLGLEPTLEMYIEHLLIITAECKRVLKPTGVLWWNHGDSYFTGKGSCNNPGGGNKSWKSWNDRKAIFPRGRGAPNRMSKEIPPKCLALQNFRLIIRLIDEQGWILRNVCQWNKPNSMPSSTKDRLTNKYEPVFFLVKNTKTQYYWNDKTGLMANRKSSPLQENVDWEYRECPKCSGAGEIIQGIKAGSDDFGIVLSEKGPEICPRCKGARKIKHSFWHSLDYWFDLDAIREPHKQASIDRLFRGYSPNNKYSGVVYGGKQPSHTMSKPRKNIPKEIRAGIKEELYHQQSVIPSGGSHKRISNILTNLQRSILTGSGKNPGDIWSIPTQSFKGAHFATFPEKLIIRPILSSCPAEVCKQCGKARVRITKKDNPDHIGKTRSEYKTGQNANRLALLRQAARERGEEFVNKTMTIGWTDCGCNAGWRPGIILDLFAGSGTTLAVAKRLGRRFIGYEIVKSYIPLIRKRLAKEDTMFNRDLKEQIL